MAHVYNAFVLLNSSLTNHQRGISFKKAWTGEVLASKFKQFSFKITHFWMHVKGQPERPTFNLDKYLFFILEDLSSL